MGDASLAAFLRKTFSERSQQLLSGSLKAPDGAALQRVISKLDEEEKARKQGCWNSWGVAGVLAAVASGRACVLPSSLAVFGCVATADGLVAHQQHKHHMCRKWQLLCNVSSTHGMCLICRRKAEEARKGTG